MVKSLQNQANSDNPNQPTLALEMCLYCDEGFRGFEKRMGYKWEGVLKPGAWHISGPFHRRCLEEMIAEGAISAEQIVSY